MAAAEAAGTLVVGVAIEVPEPWRAYLVDARSRYEAPDTSPVPPHITVLPPTTIAAADLDAVRAHLSRAAQECPPFDVRLRGTATFRPVSPVVFLSVVEGISGCERVEQRVRAGILLRRRAFPYHPHVTVAHDVADEILDAAYEDMDPFTARFRAESITLSEQRTSGEWHLLDEFALQGSAFSQARARRD